MTKFETIFRKWVESKGIKILEMHYVEYARRVYLLADRPTEAFRKEYKQTIEKYFKVTVVYYTTPLIYEADMKFILAEEQMVNDKV
jgi:hypothetical protein